MLRYLMHIISTVFHPILVFIYLLFSPYWYLPAIAYAMYNPYLLSIIIVVYVIVPGILLCLLYWLGLVDSLSMRSLRDRRISLGCTAIWDSLSLVWLGSYFSLHHSLWAILLSTNLVLWVLFFGNFREKVSFHTATMSLLIGYIAANYQLFLSTTLMYGLVFSCLLTGVVMSARTYLKAHTNQQTYIGFAIGALVSYTTTICLAP